VVRYDSVFHEYDPYFNYRATVYLVKEGFSDFMNWIDSRTWYPMGRLVGQTVYPGLMSTAAIVHWAMTCVGFPTNVRNIYLYLAPMLSGINSCFTFLLTSEVQSFTVSLLSRPRLRSAVHAVCVLNPG
jgi:dolichyl-diphosphooligosaccharide--protein glycosyltransferase